MSVAFTADTHFGHSNVIKYCNRPWANSGEMDDALIANWNSVCTPQTTVYHLGDFAFGRPEYVANIISRLNFGHLYVIKGNHDKTFCEWHRRERIKNNGKDPFRVTLFNSYIETKIEGIDFTLCHYAMRIWNKCHHNALHLYGHSHGSLPDDPYSKSFDIGVDCHDYKPLTLQQVLSIMDTKQQRPVDHHR